MSALIGRNKWAVLGVVLIVLGMALWAGYPRYRLWKEHQLLRQAQEFMDKGDFRNAMVRLHQIHQLDPKNVEASCAAARLSELMRSPQAVEWWARVVELKPDVKEYRMNLVSAAMNFGQLGLAEEVLLGFTNDLNTPFYHQTAAALAVATNNLAVAQMHFEKTVQLDPTNLSHQLNLAIFHLASPDPAVVSRARVQVEEFKSKPGLQSQALRSLVADALRSTNFARANILSKTLLESSEASFGDRLTHLDILSRLSSPEKESYFKTVQAEAAKSPATVFALGTWMVARDRAGEALTWLKTLPKEMHEQHPVPMTVAECHLKLKDWPGLQTQLQGQNWGLLEYTRLALMTRALREQNQPEEAKKQWAQALQATQERRDSLAALANLTSSWGWNAETEEVLWSVVRSFPGERWPVQSLYQHYLLTGGTAGLKKASAVMAERNPNDPVLKNNLATVNLLLATDLAQAHQLAQEAYSSAPTNQLFASTYAYSLHLQGKTQDALKLLDGLDKKHQEHPSIATYYGVVLGAAGRRDDARKYLSLALKGQLLPEQRQIATNTLQRLSP